MNKIVKPNGQKNVPMAIVVITPAEALPGVAERLEYCVIIANSGGGADYWKKVLASMLEAFVSAYRIFSLKLVIQVIPLPSMIMGIIPFKSMFINVFIRGGEVPDDIVIPTDLVG